jgi:hypothetical protein
MGEKLGQRRHNMTAPQPPDVQDTRDLATDRVERRDSAAQMSVSHSLVEGSAERIMWPDKSRGDSQPKPDAPPRLRQAIRDARIEAAERTGVVVDLRDAEIARLELVNDELDPVFSEIPPEVELFDRGISHGNTPRLWIDAIAHVEMGRDKRIYRFVQDTRFGRRVLAESPSSRDIVNAITRYVAHRLIERERALAGTEPAGSETPVRRGRTGAMIGGFVLGALVGVGAILLAAWIAASHALGP